MWLPRQAQRTRRDKQECLETARESQTSSLTHLVLARPLSLRTTRHSKISGNARKRFPAVFVRIETAFPLRLCFGWLSRPLASTSFIRVLADRLVECPGSPRGRVAIGLCSGVMSPPRRAGAAKEGTEEDLRWSQTSTPVTPGSLTVVGNQGFRVTRMVGPPSQTPAGVMFHQQ
jgi:hypothetical protein